MISKFTTTILTASLFFCGLAGTLVAKILSYDIREEGTVAVKEVVVGENADLILLDSGMNDNFCTGVVCLVKRNGEPLAEIVIAEATEFESVALITRTCQSKQIMAGDPVQLKTITF